MNFFKKRKKINKLEYWIIGVTTFYLLSVVGGRVETNLSARHLNNFRQEMARLSRGAYPSQYTAEEYGDLAQLLPILESSFRFSEKMMSEVDAAWAHCKEVLTPEYLCEYANIIQAKKRVANLLDTLNRYEREYYEEYALMESKIHTEFLGKEILKSQILEDLEKNKEVSIELASQYFQIQRQVAQKMNEIFDFLSAKAGDFWRIGDTFVFKVEEDERLFNSLVQKLIEHSEEESLFLQKLEAHKQIPIRKIEFDKA